MDLGGFAWFSVDSGLNRVWIRAWIRAWIQAWIQRGVEGQKPCFSRVSLMRGRRGFSVDSAWIQRGFVWIQCGFGWFGCG